MTRRLDARAIAVKRDACADIAARSREFVVQDARNACIRRPARSDACTTHVRHSAWALSTAPPRMNMELLPT
jgi:hypothetical protein